MITASEIIEQTKIGAIVAQMGTDVKKDMIESIPMIPLLNKKRLHL
jgi:hypothetical protein